MTPDLLGVLQPAAAVVEEKLDAMRRLGPAYMKAYAGWYLRSQPNTFAGRPAVPVGLAPELALLLREEVHESALVQRRVGSAA